MGVETRIEKNVLYAQINNPPVNAIGLSVREGLLKAVHLAQNKRVERVIVSGIGKAFAAGADAKEFDSEPEEPHLPDVLEAIESSTVPWVAAINGVALGGGAEIALACRMRIMSPLAQIGFPEVNLGVIPGAGGTQRLPRLVGFEQALIMITGAKALSAKSALTVGLVDEVKEDPVQAALSLTAKSLLSRHPTKALEPPASDPAVLAKMKDLVAKRQANQHAPAHAIDVIASGLSTDFCSALKRERQVFLNLRSSEQAISLRHLFFAERGAKAPVSLVAHPLSLQQGVVVGGGTMGAGISYALANAGVEVILLENDEQGVLRATDNVEAIIAASVKRGLIDNNGAKDRRELIKFSTRYEDAASASFAIEAAFESMEVKKLIFSQLSAVMADDAMLASNTSYLDVNEIANSTSNPQRVLGLHFFAPAHIMKLLEIVRGDRSNDTVVVTAFALGKLLRKVPVIAGVCDGFIGNRILARYREAADTVLLEGSTPLDIDQSMRQFGYAMGPYEAQDMSGLDIAHANRRRQDEQRDPNRRYISIADRMVENGRLGKKTAAGWYRYPKGPMRRVLPAKPIRC